jgi:hypothetical protein
LHRLKRAGAMIGNRWRSPTNEVAANACNQRNDVEQKQ